MHCVRTSNERPPEKPLLRWLVRQQGLPAKLGDNWNFRLLTPQTITPPPRQTRLS